MKKYFAAAVILVSLAAVLAVIMTPQQIDSVARNTEILREINRLMPLADAGNLTIGDTVKLGSIISVAAGEFDEVRWMVSHGFQHHALHALQGIYWKEAGKEFPCPAEAFAHASAYLQFNDTVRARHAVEEGTEKLEKWEPVARADKAADPAVYPGLDNIIFVMKQEIAAMDQENLADVKLAADYLDENGYC